jgi:cell division protein FtsI (penicillin-binding protein 3)
VSRGGAGTRSPRRSAATRSHRSRPTTSHRSDRSDRSRHRHGTTRRARRGAARRPGDPRYRTLALLCVLLLLFVGVVVRLTHVQALGGGRYVEYGEAQRVGVRPLAPSRGAVFDRNERELAISIPQTTVAADPSLIADPAAAARRLAPVLDVDRRELREQLSHGSNFVYLARRVDDDVARRVERLGIEGVLLQDEPERFNPAGDLARSLLGRVGVDNAGLSGLELRFDGRLAGTPGEEIVETDRAGRTIPAGRSKVDPAVPGDDLVLTLDRGLQFETERILGDQIRATGAKGGTAIVSHPETGELLALASLETDLDDGTVGNTGNNLAVTSMYEPGSVNKVITLAAALDTGAVEPGTEIEVPDSLRVADHVYRDAHSHPTERYTVTDILAKSSNVGTIKIAQDLGKDRLDEYLRRFGFGRRTALGLPHEAGGQLLDPDSWYGTSIGSIPIGQGISVTAMQMLYAYNSIANDGVYLPPAVVKETVDAAGRRHPAEPADGRRVVSPGTAAAVRAMLAEAVGTGTGTAAAIDGYQSAGKTGTARKPNPDGGGYRWEDGEYHHVATFAGFLPADDPKVSIIVVIDEPETSPYASDVAAPAFAEIGRYALRLLRIPPDEPRSDAPLALDPERVRAHPATTTTTVPTTTTVTTTTTTTAPTRPPASERAGAPRPGG